MKIRILIILVIFSFLDYNYINIITEVQYAGSNLEILYL